MLGVLIVDQSIVALAHDHHDKDISLCRVVVGRDHHDEDISLAPCTRHCRVSVLRRQPLRRWSHDGKRLRERRPAVWHPRLRACLCSLAVPLWKRIPPPLSVDRRHT